MTEIQIKKQDFAQTLARGLGCLEVLSNGPASVSEIAARMGLHRATIRRILLTLESLGYVHEDHSRYATAPKILALGRAVVGSGSVWTSVNPEVVKLADYFNEPCSISVLDGFDILFVARDSTRRIYTARLGVGDRLPAYCSASGKVLLASLQPVELNRRLKNANLYSQGPKSITDPAQLKNALKDVLAKGYATAIDEMEEGTLSIAVPLRDSHGDTIAAMSVASHKSRMSPKDLKERVLPLLRDAAQHVEGVIRDFQDRKWTVS